MAFYATKEHPLRHLEALDDALDSHSGYTGSTRWMIPYADMLTLLMGFFVILFTMTSVHHKAAQPRISKATPDASNSTHAVKPNTPSEMQNLENNLVKPLQQDGKQVTIRNDARGVVISFQERLFFDPGKAALSPESEKTLDRLAAALMNTSQQVRVEGHTDNTPIHTAAFPSNWELSTARATTIVRNLVEKHHFPPQRLSTGGYGEFYPFADNSTIEGKQKNRRVDIVLLNPMPEKPSLPDTNNPEAPPAHS